MAKIAHLLSQSALEVVKKLIPISETSREQQSLYICEAAFPVAASLQVSLLESHRRIQENDGSLVVLMIEVRINTHLPYRPFIGSWVSIMSLYMLQNEATL